MNQRGHIGLLAVLGIIWIGLLFVRVTAKLVTADARHWRQPDKLVLAVNPTPRPL